MAQRSDFEIDIDEAGETSVRGANSVGYGAALAGKTVAFTLNGYRAIVPNLTAEEESTILGFLEQAREQAVDYKNMNQISAIFEMFAQAAPAGSRSGRERV